MEVIRKTSVGLIIAFALLGCGKRTTTEQTQKDTTSLTLFNSVYDSLEVMKIPITLTPDSWSDLLTKHTEKYGIGEGWELVKHPYAKLAENGNYKAIIFISTDETGSPTIITMDRNGNAIDTLFLLVVQDTAEAGSPISQLHIL